MGDRRPRRPDSRQIRDDPDRPSRRVRDHDHRPRYRSRSRSRDIRHCEHRRNNDRSRSPDDRRYADHAGSGQGRGQGSNRDGPDRRHVRRRSASPSGRTPPPSLPTRTRSRPDDKQSLARGRAIPSPPRGPTSAAPMETDGEEAGEVGEVGDDDDDDDLASMQAMMGFGGFGTTKGKKVAGNNAGAVHKEKKTEYRQYMNRQGGFNRPLSPGR
ncbi:hypothetical protein EsDP_00003489 [Epichloe bromicola]|uniref:U4/U6.U5 small nuclear ribonucleoprotein 27kDa protein domain-containing protein n=1 Tax=Epichloe bromicola TaxID=79588 RepID=A0ABQ0CPF2_9HYPO